MWKKRAWLNHFEKLRHFSTMRTLNPRTFGTLIMGKTFKKAKAFKNQINPKMLCSVLILLRFDVVRNSWMHKTNSFFYFETIIPHRIMRHEIESGEDWIITLFHISSVLFLIMKKLLKKEVAMIIVLITTKTFNSSKL